MEMVMDNLTRYAASVATKERSRKQILRKKKLGARAALVRFAEVRDLSRTHKN